MGRGGGDRDRDRGGDRDRRGGDAFGEDRKAAAPWRSKKAQEGEDAEGKKDEDGFESLRKGGGSGQKYVPPGQRNRVKDEPREIRRSAAKEKSSGGAYIAPAKRAQMEKEEKEREQKEAREAERERQR